MRHGRVSTSNTGRKSQAISHKLEQVDGERESSMEQSEPCVRPYENRVWNGVLEIKQHRSGRGFCGSPLETYGFDTLGQRDHLTLENFGEQLVNERANQG